MVDLTASVGRAQKLNETHFGAKQPSSIEKRASKLTITFFKVKEIIISRY